MDDEDGCGGAMSDLSYKLSYPSVSVVNFSFVPFKGTIELFTSIAFDNPLNTEDMPVFKACTLVS